MSASDLKLEQIVNPAKLRRQFEELVKSAAAQGKAAVDRNDVLQLIKQTLEAGRKSAETMLMQDAHGTSCSVRLSFLMDQLITALYDFAIAHVRAEVQAQSSEDRER